MMKKISQVDEIIELAGGQTALALRIGVSVPAINKWSKSGIIPIKRVPAIVAMMNGKYTHADIRPDIFPVNIPCDKMKATG